MAKQLFGEYIATDWENVTLHNGWTTDAGSAPISWCLTGTTVQMRGTAVPPGILAGNTVICTLPTELRPQYDYTFVCAGLSALGVALAANIIVRTSGVVELSGLAALGKVAMNNVRFTLKA